MSSGTARTNNGDWRQMLVAVPMKNSAAEIVADTPSTVSVSVRNKKPGYRVPPISWFIPYKPIITIELTGLGAELWHLCDGRRNVESICDIFMDKYGLSFHEARTAVTDFLKKLIQRGVLAISIDK